MPSMANPIDTPADGSGKSSSIEPQQLLEQFDCPAGLATDGTIVACNRPLLELFDVTDAEGVQADLVDFEFARSSSPVLSGMLRHPRSQKWLAINRTGFRVNGASELWLFHDWTEISAASDVTQEAEESLLRSSRFLSVGEMTTTLAHEINQPLAAIVNYLNVAKRMLKSDSDQDPMAPLVEASEQADRASAIVRRLREFVQSRQPKREFITISNLVESSIRAIRNLAQQYQTRITTELDEQLPFVEGDRVLLEQVLVNLLKNALEAAGNSDRSAVVTVRASINLERQIEILVLDNGPGLSPKIKSRLFEPFATSKASGMGVGLSISRSIVEYHQGRILYRSNPAGGCIFGLALPTKGA